MTDETDEKDKQIAELERTAKDLNTRLESLSEKVRDQDLERMAKRKKGKKYATTYYWVVSILAIVWIIIIVAVIIYLHNPANR